MKTFSAEALAAIASGDVMTHGAVQLGREPNQVRLWGGQGVLAFNGVAFVGTDKRGLVSASGGSLGGSEQGAELTLSNVDPDIVGRLNLKALRGQPAVLWRLIFNGTGARLLHAEIFLRGRIDRAPKEETPGGAAIIRVGIEGPARGLGRRSERMRTDADQRMIDPTANGFAAVAYAGEKAINWGGKPPQRSGTAFGGVSPGQAAGVSFVTRGAIQL